MEKLTLNEWRWLIVCMTTVIFSVGGFYRDYTLFEQVIGVGLIFAINYSASAIIIFSWRKGTSAIKRTGDYTD